MKIINTKKGSVLILSIWALSFLGVFAINIALRVRQRVTLISRIEDRSQLRYITQAGIKKAISALRLELVKNNFKLTAESKSYRHNNFDKFSSIYLGNGSCEVSYEFGGGDFSFPEKRYGVIDEESKININFTDRNVLARLVENVLGYDVEDAQSLAESIIDWRSFGQSQVVGFYSDAYYQDLEFPYEPKNAPFELMDELLLVEGIDERIYGKLTPFLTIYGDGRVNINTAPREVLLSIGLSNEVVDKILFVRTGADGIDATQDDHVFSRIFDVASEINSIAGLKVEQMKELDGFSQRKWIKLNSDFYLIASRGKMNGKERVLTIKTVYDAAENRLIYWSEK